MKYNDQILAKISRHFFSFFSFSFSSEYLQLKLNSVEPNQTAGCVQFDLHQPCSYGQRESTFALSLILE